MSTKILPSADATDQLGQSTANGDDSNLRWKGVFKDLRVEGDLTVSGNTTTVTSTNTTIADTLIELNSGDTDANTNDIGIIMERGTTGDNAAIIWDESEDKFVVGTTTATGSSTGDLTVTTGTLVANLDSGSTLTEVKVATELNDANGNELLGVTATASAVNHLALANAATGNNPSITAAGDDTNVGIDFQLKGTGSFDVHGTSDTSAQIKLYEDTDDGSNYIGLKAATIANSYTLTLPTGVPASNGLSLVANTDGTCSWNSVSAGGLSDNSVGFAKLADIDGFTVIGNVTTAVGTDGNPEEVRIYDEDNMASNSATALATQQSIKAYVDAQTVSNADWNGDDLAILNGGTGASTAADARSNLGLVIGTDVQAYNAQLTTVAALNSGDGNFIVGDGTDFVVESGATARASLGLGSIATQAANSVAITGGSVSGITDLAVADGGTGASTAADARSNLGLAIGTDVQAYSGRLADIAALAVTDGNVIVGNGTNFVAESGATARASLGLGSIATQAADSVTITGGSVSGITDLAIADGGTGAGTAAEARANLGLEIGTDVQAHSARLDTLAGLDATLGNFIVGNGTTYEAQNIADARTSLGLGSIATQAANSVTITGGSVSGITDLAVADGGTGASTAADARSNLGLVIGTDVQAYSAQLATFSSLNSADGNIIVGSATGFVAESGDTARASLGLTIGTDVQAYDEQLDDLAGLTPTDGNFIVGDGANFVLESGATARTSLGLGSIATQAADSVTITGGSVSGITDLAVADGGTGASTAADARSNLGLVIGTDVQAYNGKLADIAALSVTDGNFIVGDGSNFVAESGDTARASLGLAIGTDVQAYSGKLADIAALAVTDGNVIVGNGTNFVAESGATARASLGLTIGTDVQAYNAKLGDISNNLTSSAAELNYLDIDTLGTSQASHAVTTDSNNKLTHAGDLLVTGAGKGITINNGDLTVYGDGTITNSLTVNNKLSLSGSIASLTADNLKADDALIEINYLGDDSSNTHDLGIFGRVDSATTKYQGLIYDGADDVWKFFNTTTYPGGDNYISNESNSPLQVDTVLVKKSVPATSVGASGDKAGMITAGNDDGTRYIYFCHTDYDGTSNIWQRVALSTDTW